MLQKFKLCAMSLLTLGVLIVGLMASTGCHHNVNTSNPQVVFADTLYSAAAVVDETATGLVAANQVVESLKAVEPEYYASVKPKLQKIALANDKAIAAIRAAKAGDTSADWKTAVVAVANAAIPTDLTTFGFKNTETQSVVTVGFAGLESALIAISNSFGGK